MEIVVGVLAHIDSKEEIMENHSRSRQIGRIALGVLLAVAALTVCAFAEGEPAAAEYVSPFFCTAWSLLPPVVAIGLALITKEVYSSLFVGLPVGRLFYETKKHGIELR